MLRLIAFTFSCCLASAAFTQKIGYGFNAGLNFNRFISDSETDGDGNDLETFTGNTGFHVGAIFTWKATELMGLRGELLFSQKGGRQKFIGPSYYKLSTDGTIFNTTGNRDVRSNVSLSYIDIPIAGYYKPVHWLEIYAGGNIGFLVSASAVGELKYTGGKTVDGFNVPSFTYKLDYSYYSDDAGGSTAAETPIQVKGLEVPIIQTAGAYAEFEQDMGNLYKTIDLGLIGGLSLYFNKGLFLSGRVNYGLSDLTKTEADVSLVNKENGAFVNRNDKDRNFSIQASIGFSF